MKDEKITNYLIDIKTVIPNIVVDLAYLGENNFVGSAINGYKANIAYLTKETVKALQQVQTCLLASGLGLKVWDAYRPQQAVNHFLHWAKDTKDIKKKEDYYPTLTKNALFESGYLMPQSAHSRGSTVDLTIIDSQTLVELDMGTCFDFFDPLSWTDSADISFQQRANRMLLQHVMKQHGFIPFDTEWWHFTLGNEPYSHTYFDFEIK